MSPTKLLESFFGRGGGEVAYRIQFFWIALLLYVIFGTDVLYHVVGNVDGAVRNVWAALVIKWRDPILFPFWTGLIMSVIWPTYLVLLVVLTLGRRHQYEAEEE